MSVRKSATALGLSAAVVTFALVTPGSAAAAPAEAVGGESTGTAAACPGGNICVYSGFDYGGSQWNMHSCGVIHNIGVTPFGSDHVRSYRNNQTGNVVAIFYNWTGSNWEEIGRSRAPENVSRAPGRFYSVPGGVDGVRAC